MMLEGTVTNVAAFGAFVDIGVHQDGLVHLSQLADRFVKDPHEVVKAGDVVKVRVIDADIPRKRIGLSMRPEPTRQGAASAGARKKAGGEARSSGNPSDRSPSPKEQATGALGAALLNAAGDGRGRNRDWRSRAAAQNAAKGDRRLRALRLTKQAQMHQRTAANASASKLWGGGDEPAKPWET